MTETARPDHGAWGRLAWRVFITLVGIGYALLARLELGESGPHSPALLEILLFFFALVVFQGITALSLAISGWRLAARAVFTGLGLFVVAILATLALTRPPS